jgi:SPP1 family predicted phage head-tail adaptor
MNPGKLNRQIVIQNATTFTRDSFGDKVSSWNNSATVWASVRTVSGSEQFQSGQIYAGETVQFEMRYRALNPSARISYDGKIYNIKSILNVNDKDAQLRVLTTVEST